MTAFIVGAILSLVSPGPSDPGFSVDARWKAVESTVRISAGAKEKSRTGSGTVIAVKDGFVYVLTASHVVPGVDAKIDTFQRTGFPAPRLRNLVARTVAKDDKTDLALLRVVIGNEIPEKDLPVPLPLARMAELDLRKERFPCLSVGCPYGSWPFCRIEATTGKKLVSDKDGHSSFFWQTMVNGVPGRSGGPLIDSQGRIVGVCSALQNGQSYFVHADEIESFLKKNGFDWRSGRNSISIPPDGSGKP